MYSELTYRNPAELEGEPQEVAVLAAADLDDAAALFARHVVAAARQVRSGQLSDQLSDDPTRTPEELAAGWDASPEATACLALVRASRAANAAVKRIRELQSGPKGGLNGRA